jgi:hypothetical protein
MLQLGYYEALGGWEYLNRSPERLRAVTAADVQRVAKTYFAPENRCVAIYTRKSGSSAEPEDPDIAALPGPLQARVKQAVKQLQLIPSAEMLAQQIQGMEQAKASGQVPEPMLPALDVILKKAKERLAELRKESK